MHILGFAYPADRYYYLEHDMWCRRLDDGKVEVGVTAFGVYLSGDFYMCRPKPPGTALEQGRTLAVAELSKAVVPIKSPVSGTVCAINPLLEDRPERVHQQPYGEGWLAVIAPDRWHADLAALVHGDGAAAAIEARMRRENIDFRSTP